MGRAYCPVDRSILLTDKDFPVIPVNMLIDLISPRADKDFPVASLNTPFV